MILIPRNSKAEEMLSEYFSHKTTYCIVVANKNVGTIECDIEYGGKSAYLTVFSINKDNIKKGLGRQALKILKEKYMTICGYSDEDAVGFWCKMGAEMNGREFVIK